MQRICLQPLWERLGIAVCRGRSPEHSQGPHVLAHLLALVMQMILPRLPTRSAFSMSVVRASCWYSVILQSASTAATSPCRMLQHSGSARGFGGPTAASAAISWAEQRAVTKGTSHGSQSTREGSVLTHLTCKLTPLREEQTESLPSIIGSLLENVWP